MGFTRVVCPNDLGLVLLRILRLTERKSTVFPHSLSGTDFLDRFLEPAEDVQNPTSKVPDA